MAQSASARCTWQVAEEAELVHSLKRAKQEGLQAKSGWKPQAWTIVQADIAKVGVAKNGKQYKSRWQKLKAEFKIVRILREQSTFG